MFTAVLLLTAKQRKRPKRLPPEAGHTKPCACTERNAAGVQSLSRVQLLCNPTDSSPPGSSVHGMFQARILDGVHGHFLLQGIF